MRRLEARIGELLPKAEPTPGPGRGKASVMDDGLSRDQRHEFRQMAAHPEIVEQVIAAGRHLLAAKAEHPGTFDAWLGTEPFGVSKRSAYYLCSVSTGLGHLQTFAELPPDRTALYELARLDRPVLEAAIASGEITPDWANARARLPFAKVGKTWQRQISSRVRTFLRLTQPVTFAQDLLLTAPSQSGHYAVGSNRGPMAHTRKAGPGVVRSYTPDPCQRN